VLRVVTMMLLLLLLLLLVHPAASPSNAHLHLILISRSPSLRQQPGDRGTTTQGSADVEFHVFIGCSGGAATGYSG